MQHLNLEIKAKASEEHQEQIRNILKQNNAKFIGTDHQIDTYFQIEEGKLKLRKGDIENYLIYYNRAEQKETKLSEVELYPLLKHSYLEKVIRKTHEVLVEVDKHREIYFIDNVKFHIDIVKSLGRFIEIEAISEGTSHSLEELKQQCDYYQKLFNIKHSDLIKNSYSDLLFI